MLSRIPLALTLVVAASWQGAFAQEPTRSPADLERPTVPTFAMSLELLARTDVQQELELLKEQTEQLDQLRSRVRQEFRKAVTALAPGASARDHLRRVALGLNDDFQSELERILLPHQTRRLAQLVMQLRLRRGPVSVFFNPELVAELEVNAEQQEKLQAVAGRVELEYRRKVAELRRKAQEQMLSLLTLEQQNRFKELVGNPFVFGDTEEVPDSAAAQGTPGNENATP